MPGKIIKIINYINMQLNMNVYGFQSVEILFQFLKKIFK